MSLASRKRNQPPPPRPAAAGRDGAGVGAAAALIAIAVLLAYADSLGGRFFYDDNTSLLRNASIRHLWPLSVPLSPPAAVTTGGRPLANLSFALNYAVGGYRAAGYHAVNILIHLGAALALFGASRQILRSPGMRSRFAGEETLAAAAIASLWALHPLNTEAVTYIVQRVESLMGLFFLLTLYFFTKYAGASGRRYAFASAAACLLGTATKEVIALAPPLVLLCDRTFYAGSFAGAWRQRWKLHLGLMATWIPLALFVASTGWNRGGSSGFDIGVRPSAYWFTQFEALATYLRLALWPHPLCFDYGSFWITAAQAVPYAFVVVPLAAASLIALWRWPRWGFLGCWFFGILAPTCVMPGTFQMIVEHRMYLSLAAIAAGAVAICHQCWGRRGLIGLLAVAAVLGGATFQRNGEYRSDVALWTETVAARPQNGRADNNLGNAYLAEGDFDDAEASYREAIRRSPSSMEAHLNLGSVLLRNGRTADAIRECAAAVSLQPRQSMAHLGLGNALATAGRSAAARAEFVRALALNPNNATARRNLDLLDRSEDGGKRK